MTDKQKRDNIKQSIEKWKELMYLQLWTIKIMFKHCYNKDDRHSFADVYRLRPEYKSARMRFYLPVYSNDVNVDDYVIHELCHLVLSDYDYLIENECLAFPENGLVKVRENTTEHFTKILLRLSQDNKALIKEIQEAK
jgi:hypothetical protein